MLTMTTAAQRAKEQEARNLYELKQRAMDYYSKNGVPQRMEEIMNSTFYDNPDDVYGHLVCSVIYTHLCFIIARKIHIC